MKCCNKPSDLCARYRLKRFDEFMKLTHIGFSTKQPYFMYVNDAIYFLDLYDKRRPDPILQKNVHLYKTTCTIVDPPFFPVETIQCTVKERDKKNRREKKRNVEFHFLLSSIVVEFNISTSQH